MEESKSCSAGEKGDALDLRRIEAEAFVSQVAFRQELPSTNDWALELIREADHRLPLLVLAARQTQGRGRGANRWWSAAGALTFSVVLDARTVLPDPESLPQVSVVAALAVCEALAPLTSRDPVGLKWPNDVWLGRRKVCGILVESPARPSGRLVIGIGLNVNNAFADAPEDVRQRAVSLAEAAGHAWDVTDVLLRVLRALDGQLANLKSGRLRLSDACRPWCVLTGRTVTIAAGRECIQGTCTGIGDDGALLVQTPTAERRLFSGVVEAIDWDDHLACG